MKDKTWCSVIKRHKVSAATVSSSRNNESTKCHPIPPPPVKTFFFAGNFAQFVRKDLGTTKHWRLASLAMAEFRVTSTKVTYKWPLRWFVNLLLTSSKMSGDPIWEISHQFTLVASLEAATRTERRVGIHV